MNPTYYIKIYNMSIRVRDLIVVEKENFFEIIGNGSNVIEKSPNKISCLRIKKFFFPALKENLPIATSIKSKPQKTFSCEFSNCGKKFTTKGNLKTHQNKHLGLLAFKCSFSGCEKSFSDDCRLRTHMRTHVNIFNLDRWSSLWMHLLWKEV